MQGAMNVEFPLVGDAEIDKKIKEWQQWDEVFCKIAIYVYRSPSFQTNMWHCILLNLVHIFVKLMDCNWQHVRYFLALCKAF
jgi:hypothetical protein